MLESRTFRIVFVGKARRGIGQTYQPDKVVQYSGKPITVAP